MTTKKRKYTKKSDYWNKPRSALHNAAKSYGNKKQHFIRQLKQVFERIEDNGKDKD